MNKHERMTAFVAELGADPDLSLHPCYQGYFRCFNEGRYYEAHDVLEHLWLGARSEADSKFYKGLIQIAGAFVHLRKQYLRPDHPKDGKRLRPAWRLFELGMRNLDPFRPHHLSLDVDALDALCGGLANRILASDFTRNPWSPETAPQIGLSADASAAPSA